MTTTSDADEGDANDDADDGVQLAGGSQLPVTASKSMTQSNGKQVKRERDESEDDDDAPVPAKKLKSSVLDTMKPSSKGGNRKVPVDDF